MDTEYIEKLIGNFMEIIIKFQADDLDNYSLEEVEHALRNLITKVIIHTEEDGVGEP